MSNGLILIIEDDKNTAALVETYLQREGFSTAVAHDGNLGLERFYSELPIFIVLDLMLPGIDGWDICRKIRKTSDIPILMLTAREEEIDRIMGLTLGADDYVVKPFSPRELVERVKAILRRTNRGIQQKTKIYSHGTLVLDQEKHKVSRDNTAIDLTPAEYTLLSVLMASPGQVFSRAKLLAHLYDHEEAVVDRVIDVHIGKLRHKIEPDPSNPHYIQTVRGFGYRFIDSDEDASS